MKKNVVAVAMAAGMVSTLMGSCTVFAESTEAEAPSKSYSVGMTCADLTNPIWAEVGNEIEKKGKEMGSDFTVVAANNDPATQVAQIEDFIQQKKDAIIVAAIDKNSVNDAIQKAQDAGILVMDYGIHTDKYDLCLVNDNEGAGQIIGKECADFLNENYDGKGQVGLITFYENQECKDRGEAMRAELTKDCPGAEIVAEDSCVVADKAMTIVENWLQKYPDMKAIMSIGDGGGIGANQAVKAAGKVDGFGIFAVDGTIEALQLMANGDPIKAEVAFGAGWQLGDQTVEVILDALENGVTTKDNVTPNELCTVDNLKDRIDEWGYQDQIDLSKLQ